MTAITEFLIKHGLPLIFGVVLVEQIGLPLPALPWLLAAGALSAAGEFNLPAGIAVVVMACLIADALWFYLGRYRGNQVLGFLCRISLEPDSCVRRAQNVFTRFGLRGLLLAKFVPGMNTVAPPLAGMAKTPAATFFLVDGMGSFLYGSTILLLGYAFSGQIEQIAAAIVQIGGSALSLLTGVIVLYVAYKFWQRQRLLKELRMARITVSELRDKLQAGENPVILDLRSKAELEQDPTVIRGAIHLVVEEIEKRRNEFPHDRDIVVYCSCPNEVTSARVARLLQRNGFTRVRPLQGGISAWRGQNFPMDAWATVLPTPATTGPAAPETAAALATVITLGDSQTAVNWKKNQHENETTSP